MSCAGVEELEPPWARFPWIRAGSIGWRMGVGESYQIEWGNYVDAAITTVDAAIAYLHRHPAAPRTWQRWIASWLSRLAGDDDEDDDEDEARSSWDDRIEAEGLVDDDIAYPVYVANAMAEPRGMVAPWGWRSDLTLHAALRYYPRELGWWSRWLATECTDRASYLDAQPPVPDEWARVEWSARTGVADPAWAHGGLEALICTLAATGTLPPPWLGGHEPKSGVDYDSTADDRDRWLWWVNGVFDDGASFQSYLAGWPEAPPAWQKALGQVHYLPGR